MVSTWAWPDESAIPGQDDARQLVLETLEALISRLQEAVVGERIGPSAWERTYRPYFKRLVATAAQRSWTHDSDLLEAVLRQWQPNSRARQMAHDRLRRLWKEAGWAWPTATDRIGDPLGHRRQREASVEVEAVAAEVAPGVLVKVEGMEGAVEAGLEVAQQRVDPAELRQVAGVLPSSDDGLMAAVATLIVLEPPVLDQSMLLTIAAGTAEPIGPACFHQGSLTLLLGAVEPLELRQGKAFLELDRAAGHGQAGTCVPLYGSKVAAAERAG
jgi:hypothetical protein